MTIEILRHGNPIKNVRYSGTCGKCGAKFNWDEEDIRNGDIEQHKDAITIKSNEVAVWCPTKGCTWIVYGAPIGHSRSHKTLEPSAPAEIDERAEFEKHYASMNDGFVPSFFDGEYDWHDAQSCWLTWKARAALERKPS